MLGREIPGGAEPAHLHSLGDKPAQALVERQGAWPRPLFFQNEQRAHLGLGQTLTDTRSDNHTHVYADTHMY